MKDLYEELQNLKDQHLFRFLKSIQHQQEASLQFENKTYHNFSSNNYLGLATDERLKEASREALRYGTSTGASRLITGSLNIHEELESFLAQFKQTEAALLFNSGYQANIGVLSGLMRAGDFIYSDALNHASIIDGCRLSKAQTRVYRHLDMNHLEELLKSDLHQRSSESRALIVTDSVFSMDGDLAPLTELASLAEQYDCFLMCDEAHATGVFGEQGAGLVSHTWPHSRPLFLSERLIQMGTFGKALGSFGAYVAASQACIQLLINKARSFIYSTSLPPAVIAASYAALKIVSQDQSLKNKLWENIVFLGQKFKGMNEGFAHPIPIRSPIIPIIIGHSQKTLEISQKLFEAGFWVHPIRYPTVAEGSARLRLTLMSAHEPASLEKLIDTLQLILTTSKD